MPVNVLKVKGGISRILKKYASNCIKSSMFPENNVCPFPQMVVRDLEESENLTAVNPT